VPPSLYFLTPVVAPLLAPACIRSCTVSLQPYSEATMSVVQLYYYIYSEKGTMQKEAERNREQRYHIRRERDRG